MESHRISPLPSTYFLTGLLSLLLFGQPCNGARILLPLQRSNTDFIKASCTKTLYADLCFTSLSAYANTIKTSPMQLAHTAVSVSLAGATSAAAAMRKMSASGGMRPREAAAMSDCIENVGDAMIKLHQSMGTMEGLHGGERDLMFQLDSIQTWVSAALTDDDTCMDGFASTATNSAVKSVVRENVVKVAHLTSNALAFINCLTSLESSP